MTELDTATVELLRWSRAEFGADVELAEPMTPLLAGMATSVGAFALAGTGLAPAWSQPLVLRVHRSAESEPTAAREAAIHRWCSERGFPVPEILLLGTTRGGFSNPVQVMTKARGAMLLDQLSRRPWQAATLLGLMATLHARLHRLDPDGFPGADEPMAAGKVSMARPWCETIRDPVLDRSLDYVASIAPRLDRGPRAVCHGDYHPLNIMVDGVDLFVLDWTDATVGDPVGDLARSATLFRVAHIAADTPSQRRLLRAVGPWLARSYLSAYRRAAEVDAGRLAQWRSVHLFHGWAQVAALHAGLVGTDAERTRVPPTMIDWLRREYERSLQ